MAASTAWIQSAVISHECGFLLKFPVLNLIHFKHRYNKLKDVCYKQYNITETTSLTNVKNLVNGTNVRYGQMDRQATVNISAACITLDTHRHTAYQRVILYCCGCSWLWILLLFYNTAIINIYKNELLSITRWSWTCLTTWLLLTSLYIQTVLQNNHSS